MSLDTQYIKNIISANNDNNLAVFIGAGISKTSDTKSFKLPSWNDIIEDLKKELCDNDESDYLKIAQLYYLAFGEYSYYKKLKEYFPETISPSVVHKLIFEINPHIIITTNYDNILERTIEENGYIFDTVCSDNDLVKSSLQNKLIKMHGDFKNHNIVLKEDDYINYRYNFPLIENYVKSILSTHTVLFIGYSYNDINLKQILKWIKNHSKVSPPMYLTTFKDNSSHKDNSSQKRYLENYRITTLVLKNINDDNQGLDDYSKKILSFLQRIKNNDDLKIVQSNKETVEFVLNKLKALNELNGALLEQVQQSLSNCGFEFDSDSKPILEFYNERLTGDFNKNKRAIYQHFIKILKEIEEGKSLPDKDMLRIFEILSKAQIKGIVIPQDDIPAYQKEYIVFSEYLKDDFTDTTKYYLDFDFNRRQESTSDISGLFERAYKFYNIEKIEEAYKLLENAMSICLKQRNYVWMFIAMFNRNVLLNQLKWGAFSNKEYSDIEEYNLSDRFYNLPKDLQIALKPIYDFVDFSLIYEYLCNTAEELKKNEERKQSIESGWIVSGSNINEISSKHKNLVNFVLSNKIMIEDYPQYKNINKYFVQIAINSQAFNNNISLNKIELYSCIKYFRYEELKSLLYDFYNPESDKKGKFTITENEDWLINTVFENIVNQYVKIHSLFNRYEIYIKKLLFILSLSKHPEEKIEKIFALINRIISEGNATFGIFEAFNLFIGIQYNLYKLEIKEEILIKLIEQLVNKLVYKGGGYQYIALMGNELPNLYAYARERKAVIKNINLIDKLIDEVKSYKISDKIRVCQNFILDIYNISDKKIKDKIKSFITKIDSNDIISKDKKEWDNKIIFDLILIIRDFKSLEESNINELNNYLDQLIESKIFLHVLYTINNIVDDLIKNKNLNKLDAISKKLKLLIEREEEWKNPSIF